jgi:hypothetical protein
MKSLLARIFNRLGKPRDWLQPAPERELRHNWSLAEKAA